MKKLTALGRMVLAGMMVMVGSQFASAAAPVLGKDYQVINPAQATENRDRIELVEFFWYGCPHCYDLEPAFNRWIKGLPKDVGVRRVPAIFRDSWVPAAKIFYTLETLGELEHLHGRVFDAMHRERINLNSEKILFDWVGKQGVDAKKFAETYQSFAVQSKVQRAIQMTKAYGIDGVPALIVEGKYLTTNGMAGGHEPLFAVLDGLIQKARSERQPTAKK